MTTTAHEDQFTAATQTIEPVRQLYDTAAILRRNVAELELALKQQMERAEAAEEKLTTAREDMQSWIDSRNGWMERAGAAEAELLAVREENHSMMLEINSLRATAPSVADCRACANRGRINGLSQESYCDSCIYQGRDWRQNHFVDAGKRQCEACAILPCSCK